MAHISTTKRRIPPIKSITTLALPESFRLETYARNKSDLALLRKNIQYITYHRGFSLAYVIREVRKEGIRINREAIVRKEGGRKISVSLLYISTWALILQVPTWLMLSDQIEADCERLGIRRI